MSLSENKLKYYVKKDEREIKKEKQEEVNPLSKIINPTQIKTIDTFTKKEIKK